jgi:hypothetical protein
MTWNQLDEVTMIGFLMAVSDLVLLLIILSVFGLTLP